MEDALENQLIGDIYDATVAPERFEELIGTWTELYAGSNEPGPLEEPGLQMHLRRAADLFDQIPNIDSESAERESAIDQLYPRFDLTSQGRVSSANSAAELVYGLCQSTMVEDLPFDSETLDALTRTINIRPVATVTRRALVKSGRSVLLAIHDAEDGLRITTNELCWSETLKEQIRSVFGLSFAEFDVFLFLIRGHSPVEISSLRERSLATVRTQIRSIYTKTSARNQAELLRLTLSLAFMFLERGSGAAIPDAALAGTLNSGVNLPDGRWLAYLEFGDPQGEVVLLLHDEYYGDGCPGEMHARARDRGLRVIVPARPYFGWSDPYPSSADPTNQFPKDVLALFDALDIDRFAILARRTGFRFGVYLAHLVPERVVGFVTQSPALPARSAKEYERLTPFARFIAVAVFQNSRLVEFISRVGVRHLQEKPSGQKRFAKFLNKGSQIDQAIVEDPSHWPLIQAGLEYGLRHGHRAYIHELKHDVQDTLERVLDCPVHVHCLIGSEDPHDRLNRAMALAADGADLTCEIVPIAGQMFFYSHPRLIIDRVATVWRRA